MAYKEGTRFTDFLKVGSRSSFAMSPLTHLTIRLQECAGKNWDSVVKHPFTDELAAGTLGEDAMRRYLIQDHRFIDNFVVLLASMVAAAPSLKVRSLKYNVKKESSGP